MCVFAFRDCLKEFWQIQSLTSGHFSGCRWRAGAVTSEQREPIIVFFSHLLLQGDSLLISYVIILLIAKHKLMAGSYLISHFNKSPFPPLFIFIVLYLAPDGRENMQCVQPRKPHHLFWVDVRHWGSIFLAAWEMREAGALMGSILISNFGGDRRLCV